MNVLLVEDNRIALLSAQVILEQKGMNIHAVTSGKEALEAVQTEKYNLIFMDIGLEEGTDGIIVTEQIQKDTINKDTPLVILSANSATTYQDRLKKIKFIEYLNKPLTGDKVDALLNLMQQLK